MYKFKNYDNIDVLTTKNEEWHDKEGSLWAIFIVLTFKGLSNALLIFFIAIVQISLNIISGDFKFKEVINTSRSKFMGSSEGGTGSSGDCGGGDGGGCGGGDGD